MTAEAGVISASRPSARDQYVEAGDAAQPPGDAADSGYPSDRKLIRRAG